MTGLSRTTTLVLLAGATLALAGCPKSGDGDKPAPSASAAALASSAPSADAGAADSGSAASAKTSASYAGTYSLVPGTLYIAEAKDFANVKQVKDDPSKHVGDGALSLVVEPDGRVSGSIESGPASPAVIDGVLAAGEVRGNVRRKDPSDNGLTGTLVAKLAGDGFEGTLALAESNAAIIRDGKLSLKKK